MSQTNNATGQYICSACHGTFDTDWSDEEAKAEADILFANDPAAMSGMAIVCDDCFKTMDTLYGWRLKGEQPDPRD